MSVYPLTWCVCAYVHGVCHAIHVRAVLPAVAVDSACSLRVLRPTVSGRQPALALLLDPAQPGAAGGACACLRRLRVSPAPGTAQRNPTHALPHACLTHLNPNHPLLPSTL